VAARQLGVIGGIGSAFQAGDISRRKRRLKKWKKRGGDDIW